MMGRYSKEDIEHKLNNEIKKRERIDKTKTDDYEYSILYQSDVLQNEKYLNSICFSIKEMRDEAKSAYDFARNCSTTSFNHTLDPLFFVPGISKMMLDEAESVKDKIYEASHDVFASKLVLYNDNSIEINGIQNDIEGCLKRYDSLYSSYRGVMKQLNNIPEDSPAITQLKRERDRYKKEFESVLNVAEDCLARYEQKNNENDELVNTFLKKFL